MEGLPKRARTQALDDAASIVREVRVALERTLWTLPTVESPMALLRNKIGEELRTTECTCGNQLYCFGYDGEQASACEAAIAPEQALRGALLHDTATSARLVRGETMSDLKKALERATRELVAVETTLDMAKTE